MPHRLIIGLGEPGEGPTRLNVGQLTLDTLAGPGSFTSQAGALVREGVIEGVAVLFVKPQVPMNRAGEVVSQLLQATGATSRDIVLFYGDTDIPFGQIRVRERGSDAGHRGMKSISETLRTQEIARIRIGIGPAAEASQEISDKDREVLAGLIRPISEATALVVHGQGSKAMSLYNRREHPNKTTHDAEPAKPQAVRERHQGSHHRSRQDDSPRIRVWRAPV